ncbi:hypothetical protein HYT00_02800 [Candidatus Giovannonibacteria bacterium]|nr:hypothetical protein [Candidatus Giovannonibacteria bacterium]
MVFFYPALFGISFLGIFLLSYRHFKEAMTISDEDLALKINSTESVRSQTWKKYISPVLVKLKNYFSPPFWKYLDLLVNSARRSVIKLEARLKWLSDNIRGTHINLEVPEKSEYWQNLNGAKNGNGNGNGKNGKKE